MVATEICLISRENLWLLQKSQSFMKILAIQYLRHCYNKKLLSLTPDLVKYIVTCGENDNSHADLF